MTHVHPSWAVGLGLLAGSILPVAAQHGGGMGGMGAGHAGGWGGFGHPGVGSGYSMPGMGGMGYGHSYGWGSGSYSRPYGGWPSHFSAGAHSRYYPHGGWVTPSHYYYYPHYGFGLHGLYSWYYGAPYSYSYPYAFYSPGSTGFYPDSFEGGWQSGYRSGRADVRGAGGYARASAESILALRIEPKETMLFLDGNPIGTAEHFSRHLADLRLPPGRYLLEGARAGYSPLSEVVELKGGQALRIERQLPRTSSSDPDFSAFEQAHPDTPGRPQGRLVLSAVPLDARVLLDGRFLCYGDMVPDNRYLHRIAAGPHTLEVSREGYRPFRAEIIVSPLRPVELRIVLDREGGVGGAAP